MRTLARWWFLLPVIAVQALWVRRVIPRLPDASHPLGQHGEGTPSVHLALIGDSVAAGIGLASHTESIAGQLARILAEEDHATVAWSVHAAGGLTAGDITELTRRQDLSAPQVIVVSVGVNDTKNLHSLSTWRAELHKLLTSIRQAAPGAQVFLLGVPPMSEFPALPWPLSATLGHRAAALDAIGDDVATKLGIAKIDLNVGDPEIMFSEDKFHPSAAMHATVARIIAEEMSNPTTPV